MRRLEGIVASAMDGIITINDAQQIILFNPAAELMFGITAAEALGQPISQLIPERFQAGHSEHIHHFKETGVTSRRMGALGAISGLRANGAEFPLEASISQVEIGGAMTATVILRDITQRIAVEETRDLLSREVDHRAKNALAVVQALVSLTRAPTKEAFIEAVRGRVSALGRAHSLLAQNRWEGGDLARIIADETAAYHVPGQIHITGPAITLGANAVQPLSLLIHELATNAVKYGALSVHQGRVDIRLWIKPDRSLEIRWIESGGATVREPDTTGFGSTLVTEVATRQLGGTLRIDWPLDGLQLVATFPASIYRLEIGPSPVVLSEAADEPIRVNLGARVMVVEDESLIALELCGVLTSLGWKIVGPAATLDEAYRLLAETPLIDTAVLDVNLGGDLVYPLADRLVALGVPFVFCTGYEHLVGNKRYGDSPIVRKPVDFNMLSNELHRVSDAA